jgi:hypothetical protein
MRWTRVVAAAAGLLALAPSASAQTGGTAPLYPGNTIEVRTAAPLVAGRPATLALGGALAYEDGDPLRVDYTLHISVHNAARDPTCEPSQSAQGQKFINLGDAFDANAGFGYFFDDGRTVSLPPPALTGPWAGESLPFLVKPLMPDVVFCAYLKYVTDDVAWYQLPARVAQANASCRILDRRIRRGRRLRVACANVTGRIEIRFRRKGRRRTFAATLDAGGTAAVRTRRLRRGTYRVTVYAGSAKVGERASVRVR